MTLFDPPPAAPSGPLVRVRMTVAYDGRRFHGFARNAGVRTVAGTLADALERVLGHAVELTCAGRTDTGVHAWGQVVSFDALASVFDPAVVTKSVNGLCGPEIAVRAVGVARPGFDARHAAVARRYRYTVFNRFEPNPFVAATAWHVRDPLDLRTMTLACDPLIGEHDFSAFCRKPKGPFPGEPPSLVRRVRDARWLDLGDGLLRFDIEANAFCHQMVRSIVGTLVDIGRGRLRAGELTGIMRSGDRSRAGNLAPPHGLCLWEVVYPE